MVSALPRWQSAGNEFQIRLILGDHNRFSPASDASHQSQMTAITSRRLNERSSLMGSGEDFQFYSEALQPAL